MEVWESVICGMVEERRMGFVGQEVPSVVLYGTESYRCFGSRLPLYYGLHTGSLPRFQLDLPTKGLSDSGPSVLTVPVLVDHPDLVSFTTCDPKPDIFKCRTQRYQLDPPSVSPLWREYITL